MGSSVEEIFDKACGSVYIFYVARVCSASVECLDLRRSGGIFTLTVCYCSQHKVTRKSVFGRFELSKNRTTVGVDR